MCPASDIISSYIIFIYTQEEFQLALFKNTRKENLFANRVYIPLATILICDITYYMLGHNVITTIDLYEIDLVDIRPFRCQEKGCHRFWRLCSSFKCIPSKFSCGRENWRSWPDAGHHRHTWVRDHLRLRWWTVSSSARWAWYTSSIWSMDFLFP